MAMPRCKGTWECSSRLGTHYLKFHNTERIACEIEMFCEAVFVAAVNILGILLKNIFISHQHFQNHTEHGKR